MKIKEYLEYHRACKDGLEQYVENCTSMEDVWMKLGDYNWMMWLAGHCLVDKDCHEFGLWCAKRVEHLMTDDHSIAALRAKRDWLDGKITDKKLDVAGKEARSAVRIVRWSAGESAAWCAAESAAWCAAGSAAWGTVMSAAWSSARSAAWSSAESLSWGVIENTESTAWSTAWSAERNAVRSTTEEAQLDWLRANTTPVFKIEDT